MKHVTLIKSTTGLNNLTDPATLIHDLEAGGMELSIAYNVDIDRTGRRISSRKGYTVTDITNSCHSAFCEGGHCLFVSDTILYRLTESVIGTYGKSIVRGGLTPGARMSYSQVLDTIYFANGFEKGKVQPDGTHAFWTEPTYFGPDTTRQFSDPPPGHLLHHWSGRMFVGHDIFGHYFVWYSTAEGLSRFDFAYNFLPMDSHVRMIKGVKDGLYISTSREIIYLGGVLVPGINRFLPVNRKVVASYPAVEGTDVYVPGSETPLNQANEDVIVMTTWNGICVAGPGGTFINMTEDKLRIPKANYGSAIYRDTGQYLVLLEG